jgi:hypothetical protein
MQTVRSVVRALGALLAVLLAAFVPLLAGAQGVQAAEGTAQQQPLAISITGLTPTTAGPDSVVRVSGTLANHSGAALSGITVQAMTSTEWFQYPSQMSDFTNSTTTGTSAIPLQAAGTPYAVTAAVPNGATVAWSVSFQAAAFYDQFGVFPLQVQVADGSDTADARTYLPFWPGDSAASQVKGLQVAWVWPLIDTAQQGACSKTLRTSELAGSVASGGRLSTLLGAGSAWAQKDQLTWDIDPALLSDVSVMTHQYFTGGNDVCSERFEEPASTAAEQWLAQLKTSTAGGSAFLSPYANVDVAALSHSGLDGSIQSAYQLGESVAGQILPGTFGDKGTGTSGGAVLQAAWPADGLADAGVLTSLASDGGVNTVVLSSGELSPSVGGGEDALAKTVNSVGNSMSLLVANSRITSLLGTAVAAKTAASQFALTQDFLAQTAMIAAEADTSRSLVIAPPADWNPSPGVANTLLSITKQAPWLHVTGLSALATQAAQLPSTTQVPAKKVSPAELSDTYLDSVAKVQTGVSLFKDLLYQPPARQVDQLDGAVATLQSSAWRGSGSYGGSFVTAQLAGYLSYQEHKVQMIASKKLLLAGQSGETPVSVQNGLDQPIQVQVLATTQPGSQITVGSDGTQKVPGDGTGTFKMSVHSSTIGTTTVQLQLVTQDGSPLSWTAQPLSVEVTRFGRLLLIIIGGALGILVLTSAYRLRRKRLAGARNRGSADETAEGGGAG